MAYLLAYEALELSLGVGLNSVGFVVVIPVGLEVWEAIGCTVSFVGFHSGYEFMELEVNIFAKGGKFFGYDSSGFLEALGLGDFAEALMCQKVGPKYLFDVGLLIEDLEAFEIFCWCFVISFPFR